MTTLMHCAFDYDSIDAAPTPIVDFVRWLDVAVREAVANQPLRLHDLEGVKHR